jgi:hypothetical protein
MVAFSEGRMTSGQLETIRMRNNARRLAAISLEGREHLSNSQAASDVENLLNYIDQLLREKQLAGMGMN